MNALFCAIKKMTMTEKLNEITPGQWHTRILGVEDQV